MRLFLILKAEYARVGSLLRRYPLEPFTNLLTVFLLFVVIYAGLRPKAIDITVYRENARDALTGYVLWFFVVMMLSSFSHKLADEAKLGTLEQICVHSRNLVAVWVCRLLVDLTFGLVQISLLIALIQATIHVKLHFSLPALIAATLCLVSICGFGFFLGGVCLLSKRIGELRVILQTILLALALVPLGSFPRSVQKVVTASPLTLGLEALRAIQRNVELEWETLLSRLGPLMVAACVYFGVGFASFVLAYRAARRYGLLGGY